MKSKILRISELSKSNPGLLARDYDKVENLWMRCRL
jgi:hypothetical protein